MRHNQEGKFCLRASSEFMPVATEALFRPLSAHTTRAPQKPFPLSIFGPFDLFREDLPQKSGSGLWVPPAGGHRVQIKCIATDLHPAASIVHKIFQQTLDRITKDRVL